MIAAPNYVGPSPYNGNSLSLNLSENVARFRGANSNHFVCWLHENGESNLKQ